MKSDKVGSGVAVAGVVAIAAATLFPTPGSPRVPHFCLLCGPLGGIDAVLNVLLFVPLGLGLGIRRTTILKAGLLIGFSTLIVEVLQLTVITGRAATVGDLVTNTLGGAIGYSVGRQWRVFALPRGFGRRALRVSAAVFFAALMVFTGYSLQPAPTQGPLFGHHTRVYGIEQAFPGRVVSSSIGTCVITDRTVENQGCIRGALTRGDTFAVAVQTHAMARAPTAIVRVVDGSQNEIASFGSERGRAVFSVRTRAGAMGFRAYRFALDSVFAADVREVLLAGTFMPSGATVSSSSSGRSRHAEIRLGPGSGWRLFVPARFADNGSRVGPLLGSVWIALLVFPVGYWSGPWRRVHSAEHLSIIASLLGAMLICPLVFHTAPPTFLDGLGATAGLAAGLWARRMVQGVVFDSSK